VKLKSPARWVGKARYALALGVVLLSVIPVQHKQFIRSVGSLHSWGHLLAFGMLAAFVDETGGQAFLWPLGVALLGILIEVLQPILFRSTFEWLDVWLDLGGIVAGMVLGQICRLAYPHWVRYSLEAKRETYPEA
jgi:hypothetical protein